MKTTIVTAALVALALTPLASAGMMGTICAPPSLHLCVEYGTTNQDVYRPDASVGGWEYECHLDLVCVRTPAATVGWVYLTNLPVAYVYVYCPPYNYCFSADSDVELPVLLA